jgi:hypothetical protein
MRYSVSGGQSYQDAVRLVQALKDVGIVANITVGGIDIDPSEKQIQQMHQIVESAGMKATEGTTIAKHLGSIEGRPK